MGGKLIKNYYGPPPQNMDGRYLDLSNGQDLQGSMHGETTLLLEVDLTISCVSI